MIYYQPGKRRDFLLNGAYKKGVRMTVFKLKDRVALTTLKYGNAPVNPVINFRYSCIGTITDIFIGSGSIRVEWDNGKSNSYLSSDLKRLNHPDRANNKCKSIW
jgi:hypothetical protein